MLVFPLGSKGRRRAINPPTRNSAPAIHMGTDVWIRLGGTSVTT